MKKQWTRDEEACIKMAYENIMKVIRKELSVPNITPDVESAMRLMSERGWSIDEHLKWCGTTAEVRFLFWFGGIPKNFDDFIMDLKRCYILVTRIKMRILK